MKPKVRVRMRQGWEGAGRLGVKIAEVFVRQKWIGVLWDDAEDPDWHKAAGLEELPTTRGERTATP